MLINQILINSSYSDPTLWPAKGCVQINKLIVNSNWNKNANEILIAIPHTLNVTYGERPAKGCAC